MSEDSSVGISLRVSLFWNITFFYTRDAAGINCPRVIYSEIRPNQTCDYSLITPNQHPLDGTHLVAVRGLTTKRLSTKERQRKELVGASLLRPIRTNRSSLTCRCQFPDLR